MPWGGDGYGWGCMRKFNAQSSDCFYALFVCLWTGWLIWMWLYVSFCEIVAMLFGGARVPLILPCSKTRPRAPLVLCVRACVSARACIHYGPRPQCAHFNWLRITDICRTRWEVSLCINAVGETPTPTFSAPPKKVDWTSICAFSFSDVVSAGVQINSAPACTGKRIIQSHTHTQIHTHTGGVLLLCWTCDMRPL